MFLFAPGRRFYDTEDSERAADSMRASTKSSVLCGMCNKTSSKQISPKPQIDNICASFFQLVSLKPTRREQGGVNVSMLLWRLLVWGESEAVVEHYRSKKMMHPTCNPPPKASERGGSQLCLVFGAICCCGVHLAAQTLKSNTRTGCRMKVMLGLQIRLTWGCSVHGSI